VAAPVIEKGRISGVLTVVKPNSTMAPVITRSERRIMCAGALLLGIALLIGAGFVWWINRSIGRLVRYADGVAQGETAPLPKVGGRELTQLARAWGRMRLRLEG
ncbi:two-component system sensor histidine kinase CreC, partial [Serratia marcescens]|nr:two-component system sensor histidine kinase CreC [Serratia marcescens]